MGKRSKKRNKRNINKIIAILITLIIIVVLGIITFNSIKSKKSKQVDGQAIDNIEEISNENDMENFMDDVTENVIENNIENELDLNDVAEPLDENIVNVEEIKKSKVNNEKEVKQSTNKYYIKVNNQANVVTIYTKDSSGNYTVPVKAMVCSIGRSTPTGGKYKMTGIKHSFHTLFGHTPGTYVYGQYSTSIVGNILFHSVPYTIKGNPASLEYWEYDKLGTKASAGCIRLAVIDAKWIYDNISKGTIVEFYYSEDPGPLGKPGARKISENLECRGWDPTDPNPNNPWRNVKNTTEKKEETNQKNENDNKINVENNTKDSNENVNNNKNEEKNETKEKNTNKNEINNINVNNMQRNTEIKNKIEDNVENQIKNSTNKNTDTNKNNKDNNKNSNNTNVKKDEIKNNFNKINSNEEKNNNE